MVSFKLLTALAALTPAILAHPAVDERASKMGCGTQPSGDFLAEVAAFANLETYGDNSTRLNIAEDSSARRAIAVPTYFHVVARSTSLSGGYIPQSQITAQINVLNSNFAPHGISFNLVSTDYTVNTNWAVDGNELAMKRALRKGGYGALNVYFLYEVGGNFGYCYFPTTVTSTTSDTFFRDGCSILYTTVPGGSATNFNEGKTVTHEVGHWFGLLHTFNQNTCSGSGDGIADTPAQYSPTSGCPTGRDSCPNLAGLDPIDNYMDYSYDRCYTKFTAGQQTRMINMFNTYRV